MSGSEERKRLDAKEEEKEQKTVIGLSGLMFLAAFIVAGLNFRFRWIVLPVWVSWAAAVLFLLAYVLYDEVLPEDDHYPMTYDELTDVAKKEQNEKARPAYAGEVPDLSQYDTVFIGAPVWWGDWPMIMYTFFEENAEALSGKTLVPFSTHEGSGLSGFDKKLSSAIPDSTVLKGLATRGNDCQNQQDSVREAVRNWIAELGM